MSTPVIRVENLGKLYRIGPRERYRTLRDALASSLQAPLRLFRPSENGNGRAGRKEIWALKDISLEVREGEAVGLIGRNGAGKTTLLKVLSRITRPTSGWAEICGRVGSLLEVGTGFHPELTGRENVYLSGAVLGMKKCEINRKFDEIVAFAGVEEFLDTPLKHYSTGMHTRLAFAVAAHLEVEVLLIDEVLAVGDLEFQKKCLGKMSEVARGGRTLLFVSHQMNQIRRLCQRVIWLESGAIRSSGSTAVVLGAYETAISSAGLTNGRDSESEAKVWFRRWEIVEPLAEEPNLLNSLAPVTVKFVLEANQPVRRGHHGIALFNSEGQLMWGWATNNLKLEPGLQEFYYTFPTLPLRPGAYSWQVSLYDDHGLVDAWCCLPEMIIATEDHQHPLDQWSGVLNVPCHFRIHGSASN